MTVQLAPMADAAVALAEALPSSVLSSLADGLQHCDPCDWPSTRARLLALVPHHVHRTLSSAFLDIWHREAPELGPEAVAMSLLAATAGVAKGRSAQSVELVWTGPDVGVIPVRLTEQALLQVVDAAEDRLTVVSYAVYHIPRVCEALVRAADRGCSIRIILETPDGQEGKAAYDTVAALGPTVGERATIYAWPTEARPVDPKGRRGLMHVKAAIADGERMLLSSANLTEYALSTNMELGVLITGGRLPAQAEWHFDGLIRAGVLVPVNGR